MTVEKKATSSAPKKNRLRQRRIAMITATALFLAIALAYFAYWFLTLRHHQETDDAYVAGNQIQIMSQLTGSVTHLYADTTDYVKQGDVLLSLDDTDALIALERAKTQLANTVRQTHQLMITNKQLQANIELKQTTLRQAEKDLTRREELGRVSAIGREELYHARDAVEMAQAALTVAKEQYNANHSLILETSLEQQPAILDSAARVREAWLAVQRTQIKSPVSGLVSRRSVQLGSRVNPGVPLMVVVPADQIWIDANFKETQLANMRIGQPAKVVSDFYGNDVIYQGTVVGLDMGTGSAFSLLPAQNATGNWIKVVQRLPVRVQLDSAQIAEHPLRIGLSMHVTVNTADQNGLVLNESTSPKNTHQTDSLHYDMQSINQEIQTIIATNAS